MDTKHYERVKTIVLPGDPLTKFDIGWVDNDSRRYYVADRTNARIVVIDVDRLEYSHSLGEGLFMGATGNSATAGPNGVTVLPDLKQVWAGDGDSTVKVIDASTRELVDSVNTGGTGRVDELAYDAADQVVLAANDKEAVPFVTLISTQAEHRLLARIDLPQAMHGLHQPVWHPTTRSFYIPISQVADDRRLGEIVGIDPIEMVVTARHQVKECQPAGLTVGPNGQLCIGCGQKAIAAGFAPRSLIMDPRTGRILADIAEVGGSDEVWYNPGDGRYYLAAAGMPAGAVLGVIDAASLKWLQNVPTSVNSHSVAADARTNRVFVPVTPEPTFPQGGIAVFELTG